MQFKGKVILITGGGSGIGKQVAEDLFLDGATVVIMGRDPEKLKRAKNEICKLGQGELLTFAANIASPTDVAHVFEALDKKKLILSGLVNGAAINPSRNNILNTSFDDFEKTIGTNLTGTFNCSKEAIQRMIHTGGGSIVNIASIAGITALPQRAAYMASKWGMVGLTKSTALDFAAQNIRVNCVCPGYTMTPLVSNYLQGLPEIDYRKLVDAHPMHRLGSTSEISRAILFLLSEQSSWVTGAILPVDGGYCTGKEY